RPVGRATRPGSRRRLGSTCTASPDRCPSPRRSATSSPTPVRARPPARPWCPAWRPALPAGGPRSCRSIAWAQSEVYEPFRAETDDLTSTECLQKIRAMDHSRDRVLQRLEKMLEAGRVTEDEAARVREAAESPDLDEAVGEIRNRHAADRVDEAVE